MKCDEQCFSDFVSLIESTVSGDSKKIAREAQLSIFFQEGIIKRELSFYLKNNNDSAYDTYLRLFANNDVGFSLVRLMSAERDEFLDSDILSAKELKEAGVYYKVDPGQTLCVVFSWEGPFKDNFDQKREYSLFWRKQSGVSEYPVEVTVYFPEELELSEITDFTLTDEGVFIYNTSLDRDIKPSIFW
jgi:hypothetical protein